MSDFNISDAGNNPAGINRPDSGTLNLTDLYWLAGLAEGEACFSVNRAGRGVRFGIKMTDLDVLQKARSIVGLGTINGPYVPGANNHGKKPYWTWSVHKEGEAAGLAMTLFPLLGERRQARILELLTDWVQNNGFSETCRNGTHPKVRGARRCVQCANELSARWRAENRELANQRSNESQKKRRARLKEAANV